MPKAVVVGCDGQDGSYLSAFLKDKGYEVIGLRRVAKGGNVDICDALAVRQFLRQSAPDEVYHLAAFHHSAEDAPLNAHELVTQSLLVNTFSLNHFLAAVSDDGRACRIFYAASSRVFGKPSTPVQNEETPLNPACPYGISKTAAIHLCRYYRQTHRVFCSTGILYNHESPLRRAEFVSMKVVRAAVDAAKGNREKVVVGSLDALVDWGAAQDYVQAMWSILQLTEPQDFVIATGELHSVKELADVAFTAVGLRWEDFVVEDRSLLRRPQEGVNLRGDSKKLRESTSWSPRVTFREMIAEMVQVELARRVR